MAKNAAFSENQPIYSTPTIADDLTLYCQFIMDEIIDMGKVSSKIDDKMENGNSSPEEYLIHIEKQARKIVKEMYNISHHYLI